MKIGPFELIVVFVVALIVIGPNKLPEYAKKFGEAMREFKKASSALTSEIKENIVEPLEEAQKPLREAMEPITDLDKEIRGNIKEVTDSVNNIGKAKKTEPAKDENAQSVTEETSKDEVTKEGQAEAPVATEATEYAKAETVTVSETTEGVVQETADAEEKTEAEKQA